MSPKSLIFVVAFVVAALADVKNLSSKFDESNAAQYFIEQLTNPYNDGSSEFEFQLPVRVTSLQSPASSLPLSFDARQRWAQCTSIREVTDQGQCASSHTIAPTSVMTDRTCIESNGTHVRFYSSYHPLACCSKCVYLFENRCAGGSADQVWKFWLTNGITSSTNCLSYPLKMVGGNPKCPVLCSNGAKRAVDLDAVKGRGVYRVRSQAEFIQQEIFERGPVQATIDLYTDFVKYASGVYRHTQGALVGQQSVKLVGWGSENGVDYWLGINSYGLNWGERGVFKIVRGENHVGVESQVNAGTTRSM